ncbi:hypothetical protein ABTL91_19190, partial [Acinetobacter baumannii]
MQALQKSIRENQESRDTHHLLLNLAMVGAATLLAVVLYQVASFVRARSMAALLRFIDDKAGSLGAGASEILRRDRLIAVVRSVDLV